MGIAVGDWGTILRTEDGGATWARLQEIRTNALEGLSFPTARNGWAVGTLGTILVTDDAGKTWHTQVSGSSNNLHGVFFINERKGWAVGDKGTTLRTEDSGATWITAPSGITEIINAVFFTDENTGFAVGGESAGQNLRGTLLTTTDGGKTWETKRLSDITLRDIFFLDSRLGWAVGGWGKILHTFDGGKTWSPRRSPTAEDDDMRAVFFKDVREGWISTWKGEILRTKDGGISWDKVTPGLNRGTYVTGIVAKAEPGGQPTIWAVGLAGAILKSSDSGMTWGFQQQEGLSGLGRIGFMNSRRGWAAGRSGGRAYFTDDGGKTWSARDIGSSYIRDIAFVDENCGLGVGYWGTTVRTTDGGKTWFVTSTDDSNGTSFSKVFFLAGGKQGFALGDPHGVEPAYSLYFTSNGGDSWSKQSVPTSSALNSITFAGDKYGWAVGDNGALLYSFDGGRSWQLQAQIRTSDNLQGIFFVNEKLGWVVGSKGLVIQTKDGGGLWDTKSIGAGTTTLYDVLFIDAKRGFIAGGSGKVFYTNDGGDSWVALSPLVRQSLYSLAYAGGDEVWMAGDNGVVLKYRLPK